MLLQVSGSQEGAGVEIFSRELHNLLGLDPTAVYKLEPLKVDNLKKERKQNLHILFYLSCSHFSAVNNNENHMWSPVHEQETIQNQKLTRTGGSLHRSSFFVASRCVLHLEQ